VEKYKCNEEGFCKHMRAFIPHITNVSHKHCCHEHGKVTVRADPVVDKAALNQLAKLINGYIKDCQRYIHGFSTIQIESVHGTARKRVNKDRNWTIMYEALFDVGILERNEGTHVIYDVLMLEWLMQSPIHREREHSCYRSVSANGFGGFLHGAYSLAQDPSSSSETRSQASFAPKQSTPTTVETNSCVHNEYATPLYLTRP